MAICTGDCQDIKCKLLAECNRVYKGSHPPCSDIAEALKPSPNTQRDAMPRRQHGLSATDKVIAVLQAILSWAS